MSDISAFSSPLTLTLTSLPASTSPSIRLPA